MSHDLDLDYSERAGFLVGKSAAIADWQAKKEQVAYDLLFKRLYARNHARLTRERDPEAARARCQAYRDANREHVREIDRDRRRAARLVELRALGATYKVIDGVARRTYWVICPVCLVEEEKLQPNAKYCGRTCANQWHSIPRTRARNRGIRNMVLAATAITVLEIEPWLTVGEIRKRAPSLKYGSLATWCSTETKARRLVRDDGQRFGRYALVGTEARS